MVEERKWLVIFCGLFLGAFAPAARAGNIDLYDLGLSVVGGTSGDWQDLAANNPLTIAGVSTNMACCGDASGGTTTGLGTFTYTFMGAPSTYTVSLYFDYDASTPYYNEYGTINNGGSAQTGISYEIFNASSNTSNIQLFPATGIALGEVYGLANGMNNVPVGGSNDPFGSCTTAPCNGDVGMALTYTFTLAANQEAILTAIASTTNPGGFSLETTHPIDGNNAGATNVYLTGSDLVETLGMTGGTPEPSTWVLLGSALAFFGLYGRRRKSRV
jgi:PEP-CTERM motif-containing protein